MVAKRSSINARVLQPAGLVASGAARAGGVGRWATFHLGAVCRWCSRAMRQADTL